MKGMGMVLVSLTGANHIKFGLRVFRTKLQTFKMTRYILCRMQKN